MCSPMALGLTAAGSQAASGIFGVYNGYQQAAAYRQQAGLYGNEASILDLQASQYDRQAGQAGAMGRFQAALERTRGAQVLRQADANQAEAVKARQQLVGAGKTAFAANGILLEGREGSATAMWEQDEAADLAYEQALIKQNADNEVFGYLANAKMAEAQGAAQAGAYRAQGVASRINAQSALMQGSLARRSGNMAILNGYAGLLGSASTGATQFASIMA